MVNPSSQTRAPLEKIFLCDGILPKGNKHSGGRCGYPLVGRRDPHKEPCIDCPRCHKEWPIRTLQSEIAAYGIAMHQKEAVQTQGGQEMTTANVKTFDSRLCAKLENLVWDFICNAEALMVSTQSVSEKTCLANQANFGRQFMRLIKRFLELGFEIEAVGKSYYLLRMERVVLNRREKVEIQVNLAGRYVNVLCIDPTKNGDAGTFYDQGFESVDLLSLFKLAGRGEGLFIRHPSGSDLYFGIDSDFKRCRIV